MLGLQRLDQDARSRRAPACANRSPSWWCSFSGSRRCSAPCCAAPGSAAARWHRAPCARGSRVQHGGDRAVLAFRIEIASFIRSSPRDKAGLLDAVGEAPGAEGDERDAAARRRPCRPLHCAGAPRRKRGGEQPGQRAGAERRHGDRALRGAAGECRGEQRAVHQPARQPAPRQAGGEARGSVRARQPDGERLHAYGGQALQPRRAKRERQVHAGERDENAGQQVEQRLRRQHGGGIRAGAAERARRGAGRRSSRCGGIERELPAPQVLPQAKPALMPHIRSQCSPVASPPKNSASGRAKPFISPSRSRRWRAPRAGSGRGGRSRAPAAGLAASR